MRIGFAHGFCVLTRDMHSILPRFVDLMHCRDDEVLAASCAGTV